MISRLIGDRRRLAVLRRIDRPGAAVLAILQALVAAAGWFAEPLWLAVAIAAQLALGGIGAVRLIGPARSELGLRSTWFDVGVLSLALLAQAFQARAQGRPGVVGDDADGGRRLFGLVIARSLGHASASSHSVGTP